MRNMVRGSVDTKRSATATEIARRERKFGEKSSQGVRERNAGQSSPVVWMVVQFEWVVE